MSGEFGDEGEPAINTSNNVKVDAAGSEKEILQFMKHTDTVAEIQNTLRNSTQDELVKIEILKTE